MRISWRPCRAAVDGGFDLVGLYDGVVARVGHQTAGSEDASESSDFWHLVRCCERDFPIGPSALYAFEHLVVDDEVGTGFGCDACGFTFGEDEDSDDVAEGVWQRDDFAQLLVGVARVGVGCEVDLDALVELCGCGLAGEFDSVVGVEEVSGGLVGLQRLVGSVCCVSEFGISGISEMDECSDDVA